MKTNRTHALLILSFALLNIFGSCKKEIIALPEALEPVIKGDYIKLNNTAELGDLITEINAMSDEEYKSWEVKNQITTLYDRFIRIEKDLSINESVDKLSDKDSIFFFVKNGHLDSKNGLLMDRVLNEDGLIQIGNRMFQFADNSIHSGEISSKGDYILKPVVLGSSTSNTEDINNSPVIMQRAEYADFIGFSKDKRGPNRTLIDSHVKNVRIPQYPNGNPISFKVHYTFYIQPSGVKRQSE